MRTYYDVLGLRANASSDDIKNKYRILIKKHHPDKNSGCKNSENIAKDIIEAYKTLINQLSRKKYDSTLQKAKSETIKKNRSQKTATSTRSAASSTYKNTESKTRKKEYSSQRTKTDYKKIWQGIVSFFAILYNIIKILLSIALIIILIIVGIFVIIFWKEIIGFLLIIGILSAFSK